MVSAIASVQSRDITTDNLFPTGNGKCIVIVNLSHELESYSYCMKLSYSTCNFIFTRVVIRLSNAHWKSVFPQDEMWHCHETRHGIILVQLGCTTARYNNEKCH